MGREHKGSFLLSESFVKQAEFEVSSAFRLFESNVNEVERVISNRLDININSEFVYEPVLEKSFRKKKRKTC